MSDFVHIDPPTKVRVIANPASGKPEPVLSELNKVLADVDWEVAITRKAGDGKRLAAEAIEAGFDLVISYGGDGTVLDVIGGMAEQDTPLLILPGGTANVIAAELGIPPTTPEALARILNGDEMSVRSVDLGRKTGDQYFMLRCGCGLEATATAFADPTIKATWGKAAYAYGLVKALSEVNPVEFKITIDDNEPYVESGVALTVANSGSIGIGELTLSPKVEIADGLLDVCFVRRSALDAALDVFRVMKGADLEDRGFDSSSLAQYSQAKRVRVETDPPLDVQADGDLGGKAPFEVEVRPGAIRVVVPHPAEEQA